MIWSLRVGPAAKRALRAIWPEAKRREVAEAVFQLAYDAHPHNSVVLSGHRTYCRLRTDGYRVLYRVGQNTIHVFRIEKGSGRTYRGFDPVGDL